MYIWQWKKDLYSWNDQTKYFVQNCLVKFTFLFVQTTWLWHYCHKIRFFEHVDSFKGLFHHSGNCMFFICIRLWTTTTSDWIYHLNIENENHIKISKIFNIESYPRLTIQLLQFIKLAAWLQLSNENKLKGRARKKLAKMSREHFLTANNKLLEKSLCGWKLNRKQN